MADRIEKTITLQAPVSRVWRALTDHREFGQWFGVALEQPFVPGQETRGRLTHPSCGQLVMTVTVQRMEPERLFSFRWHPYAVDPAMDYSSEPTTLVEFTLEPIPGGTRLMVTESGFADIPVHRRAAAFRMNDRGWSIQVENIGRHVEAAG